MDQFNKEQLRELAQKEEACCVSLFMPTNHVESEFAQNPIRFKNLLRTARTVLKEQNLRDAEIEQILAPATALVENGPYWRTVSQGLALFLTPDYTRIYRLPAPFDELVVTGRRFHLKPLFPLLAANKRFYVLAISKNDVRLLLGSEHTMSQIQSSSLPKSIQEALWYDDDDEARTRFQAGTRFQAAQTAGGGSRGSQFGAHGSSQEDQYSQPHQELVRFFQEIDRGLVETIGEDNQTPLLLAGVEHYLPIYREANTYPRLIEDAIVAGSPDGSAVNVLHGKAWQIMEPMFQAAEQKTLDGFAATYHSNAGKASDDVREIIPAAYFGRVDTLLVTVGRHQWGLYDPEANRVELRETQAPGDHDLLNLAAIHTYLNGGAVYALPPDRMPVGGAVAATFRFPAPVTAEVQ